MIDLRGILPGLKLIRLSSLPTEVARLALLFNYNFAILNTS